MAVKKVKTKQGWTEGMDFGSFSVFRGIPYAKPPVGKLRFKPPQSPDRWESVYRAVKFPEISWQNDPEISDFYYKEFYQDTWDHEKKAEDCLYLNIWTPAESCQEKLPVLLWIHGGAFNHGYGHEKEFDGRAYCQNGIILVTIQYRLGIFGFFAGWSEERNIGNLALLDQIAALNWIYENIEQFGGDPDNITAAGQSAGGVSVQALLASPLTKGKIKRAILQSGGGYGQLDKRCLSREESLMNSRIWAAKHNVTGNDLLNMPAEELLHISSDFLCRFVLDEYTLDISGEDYIYRTLPCDAYLLGSTMNDIRVTKEMILRDQHGDLYQNNILFAETLCDTSRVYLYYFTRMLPGDKAGAFHSSELWYMFGTQDRSWRPFNQEDRVLSQRMIRCWSNFIRDGSPESEQISWPACTKASCHITIF